jgi:hypothetical protein
MMGILDIARMSTLDYEFVSSAMVKYVDEQLLDDPFAMYSQ